MVSSVTHSAVGVAQLSRAEAALPGTADAQAFLSGPSSSRSRDAAAPSPLEIVQSTSSPVNGSTLIEAQAAAETAPSSERRPAQPGGGTPQGGDAATAESSDGAENDETQEARHTPANPQGLSKEELQEVKKLQKRDREVRNHERAHQNAAPDLTGPARFKTTRGPDGKLYAVAGEVSIDTGEAATPEATIRKMDKVIRAALAPLDPSPQDRQVAAQARAEKIEAQNDLQEERLE
ncbi:MAG: putative metalloprotease CJM1_0395 family protein [Rhodospirillales bacterium]